MQYLSSVFFLIVSVGLGSAPASELPSPLLPGDHVVTLTHGNRERRAIVHVPARSDKNSLLPVVFNFHGGGGHSANQQQFSLLDRVADREAFITVYPDGTGRWQNRLLTWNAGTCCGYAVVNKVDDVGFVVALLERLNTMLVIDRRRVYATGMSNGAMMAYRLAAEVPEHFSAIAPVAGGMEASKIRSTRPMPVMHFHSVDDPRALYHGGLGPPFPLTQSRVLHPHIDDMILRWVEHNGCSRAPQVGYDSSARSSREHTATRYMYNACRENVEVILWKLTGAGHVWPGGRQKFMERILGPSTDIIDANNEMWRFFSRFKL